MPRNLKTALADRVPLFGTFISLGSLAAVEISCQAGADWLFVDLEHGTTSEADIRAILLAGERYNVPIAIRVETIERIRSGRVLDLGADAIVLPRIENTEEAREALSALTYPPRGVRGMASYNQSRRFGFPQNTIEEANERISGIVQIETLGALDNVGEIASLESTTALFIGPSDLSAALGCPGNHKSRVFEQALDRVLAAASENQIAAGILVSDSAEAKKRAAQGFSLIAIASDALLLSRGLRTIFTESNAG